MNADGSSAGPGGGSDPAKGGAMGAAGATMGAAGGRGGTNAVTGGTGGGGSSILGADAAAGGRAGSGGDAGADTGDAVPSGSAGRGGAAAGGNPGSAGRGGSAGTAMGPVDAGVDAPQAPVIVTPADASVFNVKGTPNPLIAAPSDVSDVCVRYAKAACDKYKECRPLGYVSAWANDNDCATFYDRDCRVLMTAPKTGETVAGRNECVAAITQQTCAERADRLFPLACDAPRGALKLTAPCRSSAQCETGLFCEKPLPPPGENVPGSGFVCGTCARRSNLGESCVSNSGSSCVEGADCWYTGQYGRGTCLRRKIVGDECTAFDFCDGPGVRCVQGVCAVPPTSSLGEDCRIKSCAGGIDLFCNRMTLLCEKIPALAKQAEYCGSIQDGTGKFVQCTGGLTCSGVALMGFARVCEPRAEIGKTCNNQLGPYCAPSAYCLSGICQFLDPVTCN